MACEGALSGKHQAVRGSGGPGAGSDALACRRASAADATPASGRCASALARQPTHPWTAASACGAACLSCTAGEGAAWQLLARSGSTSSCRQACTLLPRLSWPVTICHPHVHAHLPPCRARPPRSPGTGSAPATCAPSSRLSSCKGAGQQWKAVVTGWAEAAVGVAAKGQREE